MRFGPARLDAEVVLNCHNEVGEGPVWLVDQNRLLWVDITRHLIQWFEPSTSGLETLDVGSDVGAAAPSRSGDIIAAVPGGFVSITPHTHTIRSIARLREHRLDIRMNDGKCDSAGRFWAGTMARDRTPSAAALYRLNTDCSVDTVMAPVTLSNGLDWSPDNRLMYYIDSATQRIDVFDFEMLTGHLAHRRTFVDIPRSQGMPDGMTVDSDGCIWVAIWGGGCVQRYAPDGSLDLSVQLPVSHVTSCAFGGRNLSELYITSAAAGLTPRQLAAEPNAGVCFTARPERVVCLHTNLPAADKTLTVDR